MMHYRTMQTVFWRKKTLAEIALVNADAGFLARERFSLLGDIKFLINTELNASYI